ncbi:hypothetical protein B1748_05065 [Paenibacillus sp. MY03]|jgi:hypothetical protein|uniref:hypothetical protein n=1 Tax=Paenibacillus sp. MY03 TaxID=302980 RepID=UPI000B3D325F|nr:hypothetical protein [Paenibacillus sp. MY03]OUS78134.1 hypothetical protein B1748_05065 [Paenibacillus sp. MY03]
MTLLNDTKKVSILIDILARHMKKLPNDSAIRDYLGTIKSFLETKIPTIQEKAISNSTKFINTLAQCTSETNDLINCLEGELAELEMEMKNDPSDDLLKGNIKGIKHALVLTRMMRLGYRSQGEGIDVIID